MSSFHVGIAAKTGPRLLRMDQKLAYRAVSKASAASLIVKTVSYKKIKGTRNETGEMSKGNVRIVCVRDECNLSKDVHTREMIRA